MADRIPTPCTFVDGEGPCPEYAVERGRCADHPREVWSHSKTTRERGYDSAWKKLARRQLREEPVCRRCGARAAQADHIIPLAEGGARLDRANVQSLCDPCHREKTATESARGRLS